MNEKVEQVQGADLPPPKSGREPLGALLSAENLSDQRDIANRSVQEPDATVRNEARTEPNAVGNLRGIGSANVLAEIDSRLFLAVQNAAKSALGFPTSADTVKDWLMRHGLELALTQRRPVDVR